MDAALTGLIGALGGGIIGAAGGAWGAAVIAFKGARYQADKQARSAQEQWLRQLRKETYAEFIRSARAAARHEMILWKAGSDLPRLRSEAEHNPEHREGLSKAAADLELIAPRTLMDIARGLVDAISMRLGVATLWVQEHPEEPYETDPPHFERERVINEFVTLARLDLQGFAANVDTWPVD